MARLPTSVKAPAAGEADEPSLASPPPAAHLEAEEGPGADEHIPRRGLIFGICGIALFMSSVDSTIVATALPRIDKALHSPINWASWSIAVYLLGQVVAMPLAGKISDQFGRKKVFLLAVALFTTTSLFCGLSNSIYMLVSLRFIQALGGGAFLPAASGIVSDHFGKDRDRALGMFTSVLPIGAIVGPVFGGVIAQAWSWRGIFFINIPLGIALVVIGSHYIPRVQPKGAQRLDTKGSALLATMLLSGMFGITTLGDKGGSPLSVEFIATEFVAVIAGYFFIRHSKRDENPLMAYRLLVGRGFGSMNVLNVLIGSSALGFGTLVPYYAENRYHIQLSSAGTLLSARGVGVVAVAAISSFMLRRTGYRLPMLVGFGAIAVGLVGLALHPPGAFSPYFWLAAFSTLTGLGMGVALPAANNASLQLATEHVATIAGQRGMFRMAGGILYIEIATAFLARSPDPAMTQAHIFLIQAAILPLMMVLAFFVPEHKGSW